MAPSTLQVLGHKLRSVGLTSAFYPLSHFSGLQIHSRLIGCLFVCLADGLLAQAGLNCSEARDDHELLIFLLRSAGIEHVCLLFF